MNKLFTRISMALVGIAMAVGVGVAAGVKTEARGVEAAPTSTVFAEASFNKNNNQTKTNSYTASWTNITDGFSWSLANFNNNNNGAGDVTETVWNYVKCGRKNNTSIATITTSTSVSVPVTKVEIVIDALTASKINSITLYGGTGSTSLGSFTADVGTQTVNIEAGKQSAGQIYKISFDCASGSSNGLLTLSAVKLYYNAVTLSYDKNGGTGTMTDSNSPYYAGATVTAKANAFTAPDGKMFDHWDTKADDTGTDYGVGETFSILDNTTLYAQWSLIPVGAYITLGKSSTSGYTGKGDSISFTYGSLEGTLGVESANIEKVTIGTLSYSDGSGTVQINFVGATNDTINVYFKDGETTLATLAVTNIIASTVETVTWDGEDFVCFSNEPITSSMVLNWAPHYVMNNGDEGDITSDYTIKLGDEVYTLGDDLPVGEHVVTLTYGGVTTSANNPTVTVYQSLNTISHYGEVNHSWAFIAGDQNDFPATTDGGTFTRAGITWNVSRSGGTTTNNTNGSLQLGMNGAPADVTLSTTINGATIKSVSVKCASYQSKHTVAISVGGTSWKAATSTAQWETLGTITGTGSKVGEIVITIKAGSGARAFYLNQLVVVCDETVYYNNQKGFETIQGKVVDFAEEFLEETGKVCNMDGGAKSDLSAWATTIKATFTSNRPASAGEEQTFFDSMIKYATKAERDGEGLTPNGDVLQKALARYDWIVTHHDGLEDFLQITSGRAAASLAHTDTGVTTNTSLNNSTTLVIIVISAISLIAVSSYFVIRRRKENN